MTRKEKPRRTLVIDACIAQRSRECRALLVEVISFCHHIAMTSEIRDEWDRHQTPYSSRWRSWMLGKKKVDTGLGPLEETVGDAILETAKSARSVAAIRKNLPLIAAALATDCIIISSDAKARALFDAAAERVPELRRIAWVNPDDMPSTDLMDWLRDGAPFREDDALGSSTE